MIASAPRNGTRVANGTATEATIRRVAIYTRKSTDEGLDSEFNSLDAQRLAVESYIASQRALGWTALETRYDDPGVSGATLERPAFKRLLEDIAQKRIDVVAVHRLDRLSRSLLDFVQLMSHFEAHGVAFVSVTQQFSTTTSAGRLTLHLLATFAQFERETIAERTRDKMGAARRRGMWTGGPIPLGFNLVESKLIVNPEEAKRVRAMFEMYVSLECLTNTCAELRRRGWLSKTWTNKSGGLTRGTLYNAMRLRRFLANPVYVGKIQAGEKVVTAQHEAIVDAQLWERVQDLLEERRNAIPAGKRETWGALLTGLLVCGRCGSKMGHVYTKRRGKAWRYYACQTLQKSGAQACPGSRVTAGEIEEFVTSKCAISGLGDVSAEVWATLFPQERARVLGQLIQAIRYDAGAGEIKIEYRETTKAAGEARV